MSRTLGTRRVSITALLLAALILAGGIVGVPLGPKTQEQGQITAIEHGGQRPSDIYARFRSDPTGAMARTRLHRDHNCHPGDLIQLKKWRRALGTGYAPDGHQPCTRPLSQQ
jgi:hypothetical protein